MEKEEYVVGKIAYGDEDNNQSEAGISEEDPADYQDAGSTSTGLQSMLSNPTLPLQTKMQVPPSPNSPLAAAVSTRG